MILEDVRPYAARAIGGAALQFAWLSLKDAAVRVVRNCVYALAEGWREERMRRELFALSDHLLKDIGLSRSEIGKLPGCSRSCAAELWPADVAQASGEGRYNEIRTHLALGKDAPLGRAVQRTGAIVGISILAGLHHHYVRM
jgi:uncharacterized protein YjiS (DUF1127 family)